VPKTQIVNIAHQGAGKSARFARASRDAIGACFAFVAACSPATASALSTVYPVHGTVLARPSPGVVVAAIDEMPRIAPSQTRRFYSRAPLRPGETFDAYVDMAKRTLDDVNASCSIR
jgi:hypothetical protein